MITLVKQLQLLLPQVQSFKKKIEQLLDQHPDKEIFNSLPGAGVILSAKMISEFGDNRQRYKNVSCSGRSRNCTCNRIKW